MPCELFPILWLYSTLCDCEHINDSFVRGFRIPDEWSRSDWTILGKQLMKSLRENATRKVISTKQGHTIEYDEIKALHSKPIIDKVDRMLADHYGLTDEELDFIVNYDIKYRMGPCGRGGRLMDEQCSGRPWGKGVFTGRITRDERRVGIEVPSWHDKGTKWWMYPERSLKPT